METEIIDLNTAKPGDKFETNKWKTPLIYIAKNQLGQHILCNMSGYPSLYSSEGKCLDAGSCDSNDILSRLREKKTVTRWVNVGPRNGETHLWANLTREGADYSADSTRIACVPVTFSYYEGEGL